MQEAGQGTAVVNFATIPKTEYVSRATHIWQQVGSQISPNVRNQLGPIFDALPEQLGVSLDELDFEFKGDG